MAEEYKINRRPKDDVSDNEATEESTASNLNLVLYANGLYESLGPQIGIWSQGIKQSDFNTIILWTLHVNNNGDLIYNDNLMVSNGKLQPIYGPGSSKTNIDIKSRIQELKSFPNVERVLFSIGSWHDSPPTDWDNIYSLLIKGSAKQKAALYANFRVLVDLGIDGIDSDCEPGPTKDRIEAHVTLFGDLYKEYPQLIFSFVPYCVEERWMRIAKQLYQKCGTQIVKFWSLQLYAGGAGNNILEWRQQIVNNREELGLSLEEAENYIVPGYWDNKDNGDSPSAMQQKFAALTGKVNGGMLWNLTNTFDRKETLKAYSDAMINGLKESNKSNPGIKPENDGAIQSVPIVSEMVNIIINGQISESSKSFDITKGLYIRSGEAIDAIGSSKDDKIGGNGGNETFVEGPILSIQGTIGNSTYYDNIFISSLSVQTADKIYTFGKGDYLQSAFSIEPAFDGQPLTQITGYSVANYVNGIGGF